MKEKKKSKLENLFKYLRPQKRMIKIAAGLVFVEKMISLGVPLIYGKAVDITIEQKGFGKEIFILLLVWFFATIFAGWLNRKKEVLIGDVSYLGSQKIMIDSLRHLMRLPLEFHKNEKTGEVIQKFSRANSYVSQLTDIVLFRVFPDVFTSILAFGIIFWIKWELAFVYLFFTFLYIFATLKKIGPVIKYQEKINKTFEKIYGDIFDRSMNVLSVKSNTAEEYENRRNIIGFEKGFKQNHRHNEIWMKLAVWQDWIFSVSFVLLFGMGVYFVGKNEISVGQFVILLGYINMLSESINFLGSIYKQAQEGLVTIERSEKIFDEKTEKYQGDLKLKIGEIKGKVKFQNVSFSYDKEKVLDNINFTAKAGKIVAVVGKSGEGKTTLVNFISRYISPNKGRILIDEIDIAKIELKSLRDQIAIVPQEVTLFNDTIKNNISYSKIGADEEEIMKAARLANCHEFIEKFPKKYNQVVGERGIKLSTGQKQRVAIARAILRDPKILILDEATSALDSYSEKLVQEALEKVMEKRTTFVIAHRLSTIRKADLIIVLEKGKLVESGDHKELIDRGGVYQKLSELQNISV